MSRSIKFAPGEYYHIYNRGTDKRIIFNSDSDRNRFVMLLYLCNSEDSFDFMELFKNRNQVTIKDIISIPIKNKLVSIGAYCLMPNHFHILLRERKEGGTSLFMQKLGTAYTMYFNSKNDRTGGLFQGRFKATHANSDRYLKYLFAYIHLNPIKLIQSDWKEKGIKNIKVAKEYIDQYHHSSYIDYQNFSRYENQILNKKGFPDYFYSRKEFEDFINDWISFRDSQ